MNRVGRVLVVLEPGVEQAGRVGGGMAVGGRGEIEHRVRPAGLVGIALVVGDDERLAVAFLEMCEDRRLVIRHEPAHTRDEPDHDQQRDPAAHGRPDG